MPAEVVKTTLIPEQARERVVIMDDYGTEFVLMVNVSDSTNRQAHIDSAIAQQSERQTRLEDYANTHGLDLSAQKTAGAAKKQKARA